MAKDLLAVSELRGCNHGHPTTHPLLHGLLRRSGNRERRRVVRRWDEIERIPGLPRLLRLARPRQFLHHMPGLGWWCWRRDVHRLHWPAPRPGLARCGAGDHPALGRHCSIRLPQSAWSPLHHGDAASLPVLRRVPAVHPRERVRFGLARVRPVYGCGQPQALWRDLGHLGQRPSPVVVGARRNGELRPPEDERHPHRTVQRPHEWCPQRGCWRCLQVASPPQCPPGPSGWMNGVLYCG